MRLRSSQGQLVRGRCRSTNQCAYCARLAAVETAEMLALDAIEGGQAPAVWAVLTTRSTEPDPAAFYASRRQVQRALRRRWPACELAWVIEFTTGYGPRASGGRRPHWNALIKGVPVEALDQVGDVIRNVWCAREDAEPWAQFVGPVAEVGGLMRYLALHFLKESQAPPPGWRGHRFTSTRGYLWATAPVAREAARASLRDKRELWRAMRRGLRGEAAEEAVRAAQAIAEATSWELVSISPATAIADAGAGTPRPSPDVVKAGAGAADDGSARDVSPGPRATPGSPLDRDGGEGAQVGPPGRLQDRKPTRHGCVDDGAELIELDVGGPPCPAAPVPYDALALSAAGPLGSSPASGHRGPP